MSPVITQPIPKRKQTSLQKSRLLFLTHRFPYPPNRGDRIRSYNMLRVLADRFEVTLACPHDEPVSDEQLQHVQRFCEAVHTEPIGKSRWITAGLSAAGGRSLTEGLFRHRELQRSIHEDHRRDPFDAILVFCSSMYPYIDHPRFRGVRTVVDLVDVDSMKWEQLARESSLLKRPIYALEANRVRKLEGRIADRSDAIALVSDNEAAAFRDRVTTDSPILGISNGVDTDYFRPGWATSTNKDESRVASGERREASSERREASSERRETSSERREASSERRETSSERREASSECREARSEKQKNNSTSENSHLVARISPLPPYSPLAARRSQLVFTGVLDYTPNVEGMRWFCERILPGLRECGDFRLDIVGRRANATVQRLAAIEGVNLVGEVPDVRPYLHAADIAISPLKLARGIQNKVLEAMACGLPVVTTTPSSEGIDAVDGREWIIADDEDQWQAALLDLAADPEKQQRLGTAARDLVVNDYSWESKLQQVGELLATSNERRVASFE